MRLRPAVAKLASLSRRRHPAGRRVGIPSRHASARGGGLPTYAPIVTVQPAHLQHSDPWMTKLSSSPGAAPAVLPSVGSLRITIDCVIRVTSPKHHPLAVDH